MTTATTSRLPRPLRFALACLSILALPAVGALWGLLLVLIGFTAILSGWIKLWSDRALLGHFRLVTAYGEWLNGVADGLKPPAPAAAAPPRNPTPAPGAEVVRGWSACLTCNGERTIPGDQPDWRRTCPACNGTGGAPLNPAEFPNVRH